MGVSVLIPICNMLDLTYVKTYTFLSIVHKDKLAIPARSLDVQMRQLKIGKHWYIYSTAIEWSGHMPTSQGLHKVLQRKLPP